jgi:hypothetical protein
MLETEKLIVALWRLMNPPRCHCGLSTRLTTLSKHGAFTPFYYCGLLYCVSSHESSLSPSSSVFCTYNVIVATFVFFLQRGFPSCDFEEYNYGPKSHWPSEYEFVKFQAGIKPWPCTKMSDRKCKCGMKAREEVVPSELGYGYYYGNAYGGPSELWVSSLKHKSYYMNIAHCFIWSLLCVCLGGEDMQLGAL